MGEVTTILYEGVAVLYTHSIVGKYLPHPDISFMFCFALYYTIASHLLYFLRMNNEIAYK